MLGDVASIDDRREILHRIVADVAAVEARIDDEAGADDVQRIAVGRRARGLRGREIAAGARHVLDIELLAQPSDSF